MSSVIQQEEFFIHNQHGSFVYGSKLFNGLKLYNSEKENVGIAFATDDNRPSDGNLEFYFFSNFQSKYGIFHRVRIKGRPILYSFIEREAIRRGHYSLIVDEWKRPSRKK